MPTRADFERFQYKPLDRNRREIRLIQFTVTDDSRPPSDSIRCKTLTASLDNLPEYYAVLYTWVDNKREHALLLDGQVLDVASDIAVALQHLSFFRTRYLWIDAICINQDDDAEKSWQAQARARIFQDAFKVIVWLGAEDDGIYNGLKALAIIKTDETLLDADRLKNEGIRDFSHDKLRYCLINFPPTGWLPPVVENIIEHADFQRVRNQQEPAVAQSTLLAAGTPKGYGQVSVCEFDMASTVADAMDFSSKRLATLRGNGAITLKDWRDRRDKVLANFTLPHFLTWRSDYRKAGDAIFLWRVLISAKYNKSEASYGGDIDFALLGLTPRHEKLLPDDSLIIPDVCISATELLLNQGFLRIIWACVQARNTGGQPSWLPDYASKWQFVYQAYFGGATSTDNDIKADTLFNALTSVPSTIPFKSEGDTPTHIAARRGLGYKFIRATCV